MNRLTKTCVLTVTLFTMALSPLAQVSAAPAPLAPQNYNSGQSSYGEARNDVEQVRHRDRRGGGRHHYHRHHRHHHYKNHRNHRSNRYCHYSPRRGHVVCKPRYRHHW